MRLTTVCDIVRAVQRTTEQTCPIDVFSARLSKACSSSTVSNRIPISAHLSPRYRGNSEFHSVRNGENVRNCCGDGLPVTTWFLRRPCTYTSRDTHILTSHPDTNRELGVPCYQHCVRRPHPSNPEMYAGFIDKLRVSG